MSRVIRFRAWSNKDKQFVDDFIIDRLGNEYQTNKCEFWGDDRDIVLMQFTGLLDSKGVEIYEGDVVKRPIIHRNGNRNGHEYKQIKWISTRITNGWNICSSKNYEVIGNIQQNPELLASPERKV